MLVVAVRILETIFVVGVIGCVAVLALTAVEDLRTLLGRDDIGDDADKKQDRSHLGSGTARSGLEQLGSHTVANH